eukprot:Ihof_evm1s1268 gene=Ihof_evmTU1s1268
MFVFVEGFAMAKGCTNEGRALMMLDFQQFLSQLDRLTDIRPVPYVEVVESYIKAYYLTSKAMEQWISSRPEYTHRQLTMFLMNATNYLGKGDRQKLQ